MSPQSQHGHSPTPATTVQVASATDDVDVSQPGPCSLDSFVVVQKMVGEDETNRKTTTLFKQFKTVQAKWKKLPEKLAQTVIRV